MAEVKIDEVAVTAISKLPPDVSVDEVFVSALTEATPAFNFDRIYARAITPQPATIQVHGVHAGAVRASNLPTRFREGYKKEVLDTLANMVSTSLSVDNYDIELRGLNQANPRLTNLRLIARKVSTYRRYSDVLINRADAANLGELITYDQLKATEPWPLNTTAQIIERINTLFGTTLTSIDFVEEATPVGQDRYLTAKDTSFYFHPGTKLNLGRIDKNERSTEVAGLAFAEVGSQYYTPYRMHSTDWTPYASTMAAAGTVISAATADAIVAAMTALTPNHGFTSGIYTSTGGTMYGLRNAPCQVLTLPAVTDAPVDNSGYYNRALVIDLRLSGSFKNFRWLILHYNV